MSVMVTGGAGFVGSRLVERILARKIDVVIVDDLSAGRPRDLPPGSSLEVLDIANVEPIDLAALMEEGQVDAVVHLAAIHFIPKCMENPVRTFEVNVKGTFNLYEAVRSYGKCRCVVAASTADVYPLTDVDHVEEEAVAPANIYGESKAHLELLTSYLSRTEQMSSSSLRFSNVYGPGETNPHVIPDLMERLRVDTDATIAMGWLGAIRDFVNVDDVASAILAILDTPPEGYSVFNVSTGVGTSIRELTAMIQAGLGDTRPVVEEEARFRTFDRRTLVLDPTALSQQLGWKPRIGLSEGLAALLGEPASRVNDAQVSSTVLR